MRTKSKFLKRHRVLLSVAIYLVCIVAVAYATLNREGKSRGPSSEEGPPSHPAEAVAPGSDAPQAAPAAEGGEAVSPVRQEAGELSAARPPIVAPAEEPLAPAHRIPSAPMGSPRTPSALEHAPGYLPPNDPEAESEVTGRREAPLVDREFSGGARSAEGLARSILAALRTNDREGLQALRVLPGEFEEILWPEFPQSRPITNLIAADAYFFMDRSCLAGLSQGLANFGGKDLRVERISYEIGSRSYRNFTLYDGVVIHARATAGEATEIRFAPVFAERHGIWKVYSYKD